MLRAAVTASVLVAGMALPAAGSPVPGVWTGETRSASALFQLAGRDGRTWLVRVAAEGRAELGGAWSYSLSTTLQRCLATKKSAKCEAERRYRKSAAPGEVVFADDLSTVRVRTSMAGAPVDLEWRVAEGQTSGSVVVSERGAKVGRIDGGSATVRGSVLSVPCAGEGSVDGAYVTELNAAPDAAAPVLNTLPAGLRRSRTQSPRCLLAEAS